MSATNGPESFGAASRVAAPETAGDDGLTVEEVELKIINGISEHVYTPAKRLGEVSLAKDLKCGQAIVRSAMDRLAFAGILERRHRSGTYVRKISAGEFVEMCQVRALLEGFACGLAALHANSEQLDALERSGRQLDDRLDRLNPETYGQVQDLEFKFHQDISVFSQNSVLNRMLNRQQMIIRLLKTGFEMPQMYSGERGDAPSHVELVAVMREADFAKADNAMRAHILQPLSAEARRNLMLKT